MKLLTVNAPWTLTGRPLFPDLAGSRPDTFSPAPVEPEAVGLAKRILQAKGITLSTPRFSSIDARGRGEVGSQFANFTFHQDDTHVEASGQIGQTTFQVREQFTGSGAHLTGQLNGPNNFGSVDIEVTRQANGDFSLRGRSGSDGVSLEGRHQNDGSIDYSGNVGTRSVHVSQKGHDNGVDFWGISFGSSTPPDPFPHPGPPSPFPPSPSNPSVSVTLDCKASDLLHAESVLPFICLT